jgi:hypothetical protein
MPHEVCEICFQRHIRPATRAGSRCRTSQHRIRSYGLHLSLITNHFSLFTLPSPHLRISAFICGCSVSTSRQFVSIRGYYSRFLFLRSLRSVAACRAIGLAEAGLLTLAKRQRLPNRLADSLQHLHTSIPFAIRLHDRPRCVWRTGPI